MDKTKTKLEEMVDVLHDKGLTEDQIAQVVDMVGASASERLMSETQQLLTPEDDAAVAAATSDGEANFVMRDIYGRKTGKNPDVVMKEYLDEYAKIFLDDYYKNNPPQSS